MTVAVNDTIERYTIAGVGPYAYSWRIFNDTDLQVYALSTASPPIPVLLTNVSDYTVAGENVSSGGSITLTAPAAAAYAGYTLDIRSNTPEDQPTSIRNIARFLPEIHENAYDYLSRQIQDMRRLVDASVRTPDNEPALSMFLPPVASRIGMFMGFGPGGVPVMLSGTGSDTALRTDLANGLAGPGSDLVAVRRSSAEITAAVVPTVYSRGVLDPRRYNNNWASWKLVQAAASAAADQADNFRWNRVEPTSFGLGKNALVATVLGALENFAIGEDALKSQTTGAANMAIGFSSCPLLTTGSFNTAIGNNTMLFYTNGAGFNTIVGYGAYARALDGSNNVGMGFEVLHDNRSGSQNVAIGSAALHSGLNGVPAAVGDPSNCTAVGAEALRYCFQSGNTAIGATAMKGNAATFSSAQESVAIGATCLTVVTSGSNNVAAGSRAGQHLTTASECVLIGQQAGDTITTGGQHTYVGRFAGFYNATATQNTFIGCYAGLGVVANAGGGQNVGIGFQSMDSHTSAATNCVAVGMNTLRVVTGANNTAVGFSAGPVLTSGTHNTLVGYSSGLILTTGGSNSCFGQQSGSGVTTGGSNVLIGASAGNSISTGNNNTAVGTGAGTANGTNRQAFGFNAQCIADNTVTLGDTNIIQIRAQVTVITAISDERYKTNIRDIGSSSALIRDVRIVRYNWDNSKQIIGPDGGIGIEEDGQDWPSAIQVGVLAQNLDAIQKKHGFQWLDMVDKTNPNLWAATPGKLLFPLIASHQELYNAHESLERAVEAWRGETRTELEQLKARVTELEGRLAA